MTPARRGDPVRPARIEVPSEGGRYPVHVGSGVIGELPELLAERVPAHRYALVGDDRVIGLHGDRVASLLRSADARVDVFPFPEGEEHKSRTEWARLTDALLEAGLGRDAAVLALGGGVSGDLAGFVAATYMRGVPVVQIPTSLVAMVDSSVGGKTGVDVPAGKNLVGAFHPPRFVLADTDLARTLPPEERSEGLAEAVKHGAILDPGYLEWIEEEAAALLEGADAPTARLVARSVELKAGVVARDEREAGMREILNFGHTLGHALEAVSGYRLRHGRAVAVGMVLEAGLGQEIGATEEGTAGRLARALRAVGLPTTLPDGLDPAEIVDRLARDKKARAGEVRFVLPERAGRVRPAGGASPGWSRPVPDEVVRAVLETAGESAI